MTTFLSVATLRKVACRTGRLLWLLIQVVGWGSARMTVDVCDLFAVSLDHLIGGAEDCYLRFRVGHCFVLLS